MGTCSDLNRRSVLDLVKFKGIQFMVSKERKESPYADGIPKSDYSVFGLCHSADLPKPVMRQILDTNDEINFTLVISKKQKWFILGYILFRNTFQKKSHDRGCAILVG